jgi:acyl-CoA synthetase (AMP-forming)/AMP-acid ligase II
VKADAVVNPDLAEYRTRDCASLVDVYRRHARERPSDVVYRWLQNGEEESASLTFAALDRRARAIAATLQAEGLGGGRALLLQPPGLEFVCAFLGCLYAGAVAVPVGVPAPRQSPAGLWRVASDADVDIVLAPTPVREALHPHRGEGASAEVPWIATECIPDAAAEAWADPGFSSENLALLQYTSGSTGSPKGVAVTHGNLLRNQEMIAAAFGHSQSTVFVGWLPLHHDMGLIGNVLQPLFLGIPCALMAPLDFIQKPVRWLEAITRYRATTSGAPNFAYELCVRRVSPERRKGLDLASWRVAYNGAEPIRAETLERFGAAFEPCGFRYESFYPCYGMAEATLFATGGRSDDAPVTWSFDARALEEHRVVNALPGVATARRLVGCGQPWGELRAAIVDPETLRPSDPDRVGEIWLSGPSIARGYTGQPERSAQVFGARLSGGGEGAFLRTGDLGFVRGDQLFVTGRLKDLIIVRGRNYYPQDLEATAAASHPALRPGGAAAVAVEGEDGEQLVVVQEVRPAGRGGVAAAPSSPPELCGAIREAMSRDHGLRAHDVVLVEAGTLPKTSSGKIRRAEVRRLYLEGALVPLEGPENPTGV